MEVADKRSGVLSDTSGCDWLIDSSRVDVASNGLGLLFALGVSSPGLGGLGDDDEVDKTSGEILGRSNVKPEE